jgi:hypothetical protein
MGMAPPAQPRVPPLVLVLVLVPMLILVQAQPLG